MYQKLDLNLNSYKTNKQKKHLIMYKENMKTSRRHQQQKLLTEFENKLFLKKRIDSIVRNEHSRTLKNTMTASVTTSTALNTTISATLSSQAPSAASSWLRILNLFKTNHHRRYLPHKRQLLLTVIVFLAVIVNSMSLANADDKFNNKYDDGYNASGVVDADDFKITATTIPITMQQHYQQQYDNNSNNNNNNDNENVVNNETSTFAPIMAINESLWFNHTSASTTTKTSNNNNSSSISNAYNIQKKFKTKFNPADSIFLRFAKHFTADNSLWSGIIQDCYRRPTFSCFQKNVYYYLNDVLETRDVNVTQRLKFYKNQNQYDYEVDDEATAAADDVVPASSTASYLSMDSVENLAAENVDETDNEIPHRERSLADNPRLAETPIEEVTNALYGKSIKFAMTHDIELKLPEMMFDGATFRISPQAIEGNGVIAKLELIPKQQSEARLAGKILMKKIQKFLKSKLLLSFLALVLIIKIIKIKLFWLLPLVIGVGAAKKLLLKFLLFLFPALSHLFKLCSYYQQTYHSTKYHHHHHHINHHHTVVPAWHSAESPHIPEIIYTHPPKGHVSAYLHGAPIHETYGPHSHEHYDSGWANSGPGLGSEFISDINRVAHVDDKTNQFKPHSNNDANELHAWGLGTTPINNLAQKKRTPPHATTLQKPSIAQQQLQQQQQHPQNYQKPQATSHTFNPFIQSPQQLAGDKQSFYHNKYRNNVPAQSAPSPVYTPARQPSLPPLQPQIQSVLSQAAQIAAQYDPARNQQQQQQTTGQTLPPQTQLSPELSAQLKEAIRIQAEQRLVQQQQQILNKQPFVQDGKPLMPLNYDPFYSPILLKIDKIVEQLGVTDDLCKERLVCSMYKDPQRYSPHSNFVSAELSRDTNELEPIQNTNQAVIRFFRLIQAARDGQDHKDCMALYPNCNINTE